MIQPPTTVQGRFIRRWATAAAAMAYLRAEADIPEKEKEAIRPWLHDLAAGVSMAPDVRPDRRNNHFYWSAFSVGAVGRALKDDALIDHAREAYRKSRLDIQRDGHLTKEARRGRRAWMYHDFSALPLVMLAELGARAGEDWYAYDDGALHRLVGFVLEGYRDPQIFARLSGVQQEMTHLERRLDWYPLYARRFPERVLSYQELGLDRHDYWDRLIAGTCTSLRNDGLRSEGAKRDFSLRKIDRMSAFEACQSPTEMTKNLSVWLHEIRSSMPQG